jgi:hypothetical protein
MDDREASHGGGDAATALAWARLEEHFQRHTALIDRFRAAGPLAVVGMLQSGTNEAGDCLSPFERSALVERYCELFGGWPEECPLGATRTTPSAARAHERETR